MTDTEKIAALLASLTDDGLRLCLPHGSVRDGAGNLREVTEAEVTFYRAAQAEWRRRRA